MIRSASIRRSLACGLLLVVFGGAAARADGTTPPLAQAGEARVSVEEVLTALTALDPAVAAALLRDPAKLEQAVRALLVQRLVLQEALAKQWDRQPSVVAELERVRQATLVEGYLASITSAPADFPGAADVEGFYEAHRADFFQPRRYDLAQIFIALPPGADAIAIDRANGKLEAARKSLAGADADFAITARAASDDQASAARGGEVGWLSESQIQPELRAQVGALAKGGVTEPIRLADGWHFLKVIDIAESRTLSLAEARAQIVRQLRAERSQALRQAYLSEMAKKNPAAIDQVALAKINLEPSRQ